MVGTRTIENVQLSDVRPDILNKVLISERRKFDDYDGVKTFFWDNSRLLRLSKIKNKLRDGEYDAKEQVDKEGLEIDDIREDLLYGMKKVLYKKGYYDNLMHRAEVYRLGYEDMKQFKPKMYKEATREIKEGSILRAVRLLSACHATGKSTIAELKPLVLKSLESKFATGESLGAVWQYGYGEDRIESKLMQEEDAYRMFQISPEIVRNMKLNAVANKLLEDDVNEAAKLAIALGLKQEEDLNEAIMLMETKQKNKERYAKTPLLSRLLDRYYMIGLSELEKEAFRNYKE